MEAEASGGKPQSSEPTWQANGLFLFRRAVWAGIAVVLVGAAGFAGINHIRQRAREIAYDTMPGIFSSVEASANAGQAFNSVMMLLMADSPEARGKLGGQVKAFSKKAAGAFEAYQARDFSSRGPNKASRFA